MLARLIRAGSVFANARHASTKADLRKIFSSQLSSMFGTEVPEYNNFTQIVAKSNQDFLTNNPSAKVDSEHRVLAEKHGAIRVGTANEMNVVTRIFSFFGMKPVEFYDMTQLPKGALPIIGTAFRPIDSSIETSAFRMFCSMLHPNYIPQEVGKEVKGELENRTQFSDRLIILLNLYERDGKLDINQEEEFIDEVVNAFRIKTDRPINFPLYRKLREINDVFSDIVCLGININHLTPRTYDIRDAQQRLEAQGIPMKDGGIEGPPIRDDGPNIQLNQTSRKAPGEPLYVTNDKLSPQEFEQLKANAPKVDLQKDEPVADYLARVAEALKSNKLVVIQHKARFGEIESRGTALTVEGEALYKKMLQEKRYKKDFPKTHEEMFKQGLAYYTFEVTEKFAPELLRASMYIRYELSELLDSGYIRLVPQTYDDFLAASAAGIFTSNMSTGVAGIDKSVSTDTRANKDLLEKAMGTSIISRHDLYQAVQAESAKNVYAILGIKMPHAFQVECDRAISKNPSRLAVSIAGLNVL